MRRHGLKRNSSGQVLVVAALLIALLLLSTALFVIELGKEVPSVAADDGNVFSDYKQSFRNAMISALANMTSVGGKNVLADDLDQLKTAIYSRSYQAMLVINYTPLSSEGYQDGFRINQGQTGQGVASAYVTFVLESSSSLASSNIEYEVNVTSEVDFTGSYQQIDQTTKIVELKIHILNEGNYALAENFSFSYQNATALVKVDSPNIATSINGTYTVSFGAVTGQTNEPLSVSLTCQDMRGITLGANSTCNST
jgi:hypothetical protein